MLFRSRSIYQTGADIRTIKGNGEFSFRVKDNYSVGCQDSHDKDDKIFTGSQFSNAKNSFGSLTWNPGNLGEKDDLKVKALTDDNGKVLRATDLFTSPNPPYTAYDASKPNPKDHEAPADIYNALRYKTLPSIIVEKNIGDPRWRNLNTVL